MTKVNYKGNAELASKTTLSVLLIDASSDRTSVLKRALKEFTYRISACIENTQNLLADIEQYNPDVLVVGIDLPDSNTLNDIAMLNIEKPHPVVMFAEKGAPQIIQKAVKAGVNAYIVDDIQPQRLQSIITVAIARFQEHQRLVNELQETKSKLAERKMVDRAKGLIMKQQGISEDEAYKSLRKMAMDKGQSLASIAENVIDVFEMLNAS